MLKVRITVKVVCYDSLINILFCFVLERALMESIFLQITQQKIFQY